MYHTTVLASTIRTIRQSMQYMIRYNFYKLLKPHESQIENNSIKRKA